MTKVDRRSRAINVVPLLCFLIVVVEGYDLVSYSTVLPKLLAAHSMGLTAGSAGLIGSCALLGLLFGSLVSGPLADRVGRRRVALLGVSWFSFWMAVCALATNVTEFAVARCLVGLGLGSIVAAAGVLAVEFAPPGKAQSYSARTWIGAGTGGLLATGLAFVLIPRFGPSSMFWAGAAPLVTLVPLLFALLPESPAYLLARGRASEAAATARRFGLPTVAAQPATTVGARPSISVLFTRANRFTTVLLGLLSALVLLVIYGLSTWLPVLMQGRGTGASPLLFLLMLNGGGMVLPLATGGLADRKGPRVVTAGVLAAATVCVALLTASIPTPLLLLFSFLAGGGTIGAQVLIYGLAATNYPQEGRASAVAWVSAVGRIGAIVGPSVTGFVLAAGGRPGSIVLLFAGLALVAALGALALRQRNQRVATTAPTGAPRT